ncbi:MAG: hypothetical protein KGH87_00615 [Thaumarchaeota archaeon]|nr:hypothetical protein [Candidatus Nitrosotalea sp.]MDE1813251.1 hypothetical protein [Nitrososphaerota archaeon]MDE1838398.1 hypothetical protein [Nitrososphaerota archaeon]
MITAAVVREQGITFTIVLVKKYVIDSSLESDKAIVAFTPVFSGLPIVLMAQDHRGVPKYYGRHDIVHFLAKIPLQCIPWKKYSVS